MNDIDIKLNADELVGLLSKKEGLGDLVTSILNQVLEHQMQSHIGAGRYEQSEARQGYRNGYRARQLYTRIGQLTLRVPQTRDGSFCTEIFKRYQRHEQAFVLGLMEMYLQGVSTRKVTKITEGLSGVTFSKSTVSQLCVHLDARLKAFANHGAAEVIVTQPGMILMQRANPGTTLKEYFPDRNKPSVAILCECIQQLQKAEIPKQHDFLHLQELLSILDNDLDIPGKILSKAKQLREKLLSSTEKTALLHGDLHHENILKHGDGLLVIDPKGFVGDSVFEVCAFTHNPMPELLQQANPIEIINDRIQLCADLLGFDQQRIQDWLYVKSVLCWAWCLDDNIEPDYFKRFVSLLDERVCDDK